jgi:hypothetical protein
LIIDEALWSITGALIRISGCCVVRIIVGAVREIPYVITVTLGFCVLHGIGSVLEICLICRPLAAQWDPHVKGVCGNQVVSFTVIEISGLVLDLIILVSPLPRLLRMQMSVATKVKTIILLDAGVV